MKKKEPNGTIYKVLIIIFNEFYYMKAFILLLGGWGKRAEWNKLSAAWGIYEIKF